jgi:DNA-binding NtrC family response regulator
VIERAVALEASEEITPESLPFGPGLLRRLEEEVPPRRFNFAEEEDALTTLEELEKKYIEHVLGRLSGNYTKTARALGISLSTLKRKVRLSGLGSAHSKSTDDS